MMMRITDEKEPVSSPISPRLFLLTRLMKSAPLAFVIREREREKSRDPPRPGRCCVNR